MILGAAICRQENRVFFRRILCIVIFWYQFPASDIKNSVGIDLKELVGGGSAAEMFEILPRHVYGRFSLKNERL